MPSQRPGLIQPGNLQSVSQTNSRAFSRTIYIIGEGRTEETYFSCLKKSDLLQPDVDLKVIRKVELDKDDSDRYNMCMIAEDMYNLNGKGKSTPHRVITLILNKLLKQIKEGYPLEGEHIKIPSYEMLKQDRVHLIDDFDYTDYVDEDNCVIDVMDYQQFILDYIKETYGIDFVFEDTDLYYSKTYRPLDWKEIYIVFDRDYHPKYFPDSYYEFLMDWGEKHGINYVVSAPAFEIWLLMHFEDAHFPIFDRPDKDYKDFLTEMLYGYDEMAAGSMHDEKYMSEERFNRYYHDRIRIAIEATKSYEFQPISNPPRELKRNTGTCMGRFIESIIRNSS